MLYVSTWHSHKGNSYKSTSLKISVPWRNSVHIYVNKSWKILNAWIEELCTHLIIYINDKGLFKRSPACKERSVILRSINNKQYPWDSTVVTCQSVSGGGDKATQAKCCSSQVLLTVSCFITNTYPHFILITIFMSKLDDPQL